MHLFNIGVHSRMTEQRSCQHLAYIAEWDIGREKRLYDKGIFSFNLSLEKYGILKWKMCWNAAITNTVMQVILKKSKGFLNGEISL